MPNTTMQRSAYLEALQAIAESYTDHPAAMTEEVRELACQWGRDYGSQTVLSAWRDYLAETPGGSFSNFTDAVELEKPERAIESACVECGRATPALCSDGRCLGCKTHPRQEARA